MTTTEPNEAAADTTADAGAADRVEWNGTTIDRLTLYGPEEQLDREELWLRYRLAIQVLEQVMDNIPDTPETWPEELVALTLGADDSSAPRVKGSLADPCAAVLITHLVDADGRREVDRHGCIYRRGHAEQPEGSQKHRTAGGAWFDTDEIEEHRLGV